MLMGACPSGMNGLDMHASSGREGVAFLHVASCCLARLGRPTPLTFGNWPSVRGDTTPSGQKQRWKYRRPPNIFNSAHIGSGNVNRAITSPGEFCRQKRIDKKLGLRRLMASRAQGSRFAPKPNEAKTLEFCRQKLRVCRTPRTSRDDYLKLLSQARRPASTCDSPCGPTRTKPSNCSTTPVTAIRRQSTAYCSATEIHSTG